MLGATADTNIYVSALHFGGRPLQFLELARRKEIKLSLTEPILAEVVGVLRGKFHWEEDKVRAVAEDME